MQKAGLPLLCGRARFFLKDGQTKRAALPEDGDGRLGLSAKATYHQGGERDDVE